MRNITAVFTCCLLLGVGTAAAGTLVVLNKSEASASLLDAATGEEKARLDTGNGPHEVAVTPDGKLAVVGNYGNREGAGSTLTVLDIPGAKVVRTIDLKLDGTVYRRPHGLMFVNDRELVVTVEANQAVLVVDVLEGKALRVIETGQSVSHMVALVPRDMRAFVANIGSGTATALDLKTGTKISDIATGEGAEGIVASPDEKEIWVTNRAADTVTVIDADSLKVLANLDVPGFPIRATFTPDGKHVLVSCARGGEVAVIDAAKRKIARKISMKARAEDDLDQRLFGDSFGDSPVPIGILVTPDGSTAYVANTNADVITVLDLKAWKIAGRFTAGKQPDGMAWSALAVE